ncbi:SET domain-containing protein [Rickenella mellea]|uniref:SET domain-containing protein n=1 Tax=Rickenella mellea TaxID=50990 RepID=A0A4Y7QCA8_9AGAM|nr:SET domain-containing protein [Rickenella mellea]
MTPHPAYESCAPSDRCITIGDDPDDMPFIPYVDDDRFDLSDYCDHYDSFIWDKPIPDPDLDAIIIEAVRRLHVYHDLPLETIENANIFPQKILPQFGLLDQAKQRDLLQWTTYGPDHADITMNVLPPPQEDLKTRLEYSMQLFCPYLSCIESCCKSHVVQGDDRPMPTESSAESASQSETPCGPQCYLFAHTQTPSDNCNDSTAMETLRCILSVVPGSTPCQLSTACRRPCRDVRTQPRLRPVSTQSQSMYCVLNVRFRNPPCTHSGPCSADTDCACFLNDSHCNRNCWCPDDCTRRFAGCQCIAHKKGRYRTCDSVRCPCARSGRECDPELCTKYRCSNAKIQQGIPKRVVVQESQWGYGLFLAENVKDGDFIIEYTGQFIYEPTVNSREYVLYRPSPHRSTSLLTFRCLYVHRGRNYVFGLNETFSLDGTSVGNESRFVNHTESKRANCRPVKRLVHGDHRIGIFATKFLKAGTELLFDYGPDFFKTS